MAKRTAISFWEDALKKSKKAHQTITSDMPYHYFRFIYSYSLYAVSSATNAGICPSRKP